MLSATIYSEAGGVAKTTLTANVAVAESRAGRDVLVVDLDPQEGNLTHLLDVDEDRSDQDADSLALHLIGRGRGEFGELVRAAENGVDVLPAHDHLEDLSEWLIRERDQRQEIGEDWDPTDQLRRVLLEAGVPEEYDTILIDPPATPDRKLHNALAATRSLMIPAELSGKGQQSVDGLERLVVGLEEETGVDLGVLAAVPIRYKATNDQERILEEVESMGFDVPVIFRDRTSLFEGCWSKQMSAFRFVDEVRRREYEVETVEKFDELAAHLRNVAGEPDADAEVAA